MTYIHWPPACKAPAYILLSFALLRKSRSRGYFIIFCSEYDPLEKGLGWVLDDIDFIITLFLTLFTEGESHPSKIGVGEIVSLSRQGDGEEGGTAEVVLPSVDVYDFDAEDLFGSPYLDAVLDEIERDLGML